MKLIFFYVLFLGIAGCTDNTLPLPADSEAGLERQGYLIHGLKDHAGIKRVVSLYNQLNPFSGVPDEVIAILRERGLLDGMAIINDLNQMEELGVEIVDLVPRLSPVTNDGLIDRLGGNSALDAVMPSRGSLAGQDSNSTPWTTYEEHEEGNQVVWRGTMNGGGNQLRYYGSVMPDGTEWRTIEKYDSNGDIINWYDEVTGPDGETLVREEGEGPRPTGEPLPQEGEREEPVDDEPTATNGEVVVVSDDEEEVAGYQPADGGATYCPLLIGHCRLMLENALAGSSLESIKSGFIRINPDPDDQPEAPRLSIDPGDLVINPDPNVIESVASSGQRKFRMALPVWILPPRPEDE